MLDCIHCGLVHINVIIIIIITDEYDLGGTVALLLQHHLTLLIVSHVETYKCKNVGQRDGRPAEYRGCPLFKVTKFG